MSRLLRIAEAVDIPVVIVHLTNAAALRRWRPPGKRGQKVYAETCPQYLLLDDSVYDNPDYSLAARYVCAPPSARQRIRRPCGWPLRRGEIQNHLHGPLFLYAGPEARTPAGDFTKIPGGLPGWRPVAS